MKISLVFPPTWHPSQPYLSLPSLTGFLRQHGVQHVGQRDIGIELLDWLLTRRAVARRSGEYLRRLAALVEQRAQTEHSWSAAQ